MSHYTPELVTKCAAEYEAMGDLVGATMLRAYAEELRDRKAARLDRRGTLQEEQFLHAIAAVTDILDGRDTGAGVCNEPWQSVRMRLIELVRRANAPGEPALYQHDDGRYALALGDVARHKLTDGDPGWHRVPLDVVAAGEDPPGLGALSQDYLDACRFRLLTDDHGDREVRDQVRRIIERLPVMSYAAACRDLDEVFRNKAKATGAQEGSR